MVGLTAERPSVNLKDILVQEPIKLSDVGSMGIGGSSYLSCDIGGGGGCTSCRCIRGCEGCHTCHSYLPGVSTIANNSQERGVTGINDFVSGVSLKKGDDQFGRFRASSPLEYYHESYVPDTSKDYPNQ